jgi:S-DNA-T family DNA segregation ATPase FtsK/SpoIIIE
MPVELIHRPARAVRPPAPMEARQLEPPPLLPEGRSGTGIQGLLPVAGAMGSMSVMILFRGSGLAAIGALVMVATVVATGALLLSQRGQAQRSRRHQRERYVDYLERLREELATEERHRREAARLLDPPPAALLDVIRDPARRWERRRRDKDFLTVRIGAGTLPCQPLGLRDRGTAVQPTDPFMLAEATAVTSRFAVAPGLPLGVPLDLAGDVSIVGDRDGVLGVARAIVLQLAALHAPEDAGLAIAHPPAAAADWAWLGWLPHLADRHRRDAGGALRRRAETPQALAQLIADELAERSTSAAAAARHGGLGETAAARHGGATEKSVSQRLLVVLDGYGHTATPLPVPDRAATAAALGLTVLHLVGDRLQEPEEVTIRITVDPESGKSDVRTVVVEDFRGEQARTVRGELDRVPVGLAEGVARYLAPLRLSPDSYDDGSGTSPARFTELLDLPDPERIAPRTQHGRDFLRVPVGVDDAGRPVYLDLKESAQYGMGPHGLCVGATGSGKSELLRTLVLSLLVTHSPDQLSMVLVDYKGGATFAPFEGVPHVAGVITNLDGDASLVERVHTSLAGEVQRRQQVLADAGFANVTDYRVAGNTGISHLLVIIDEFGELITAKPDFIELFLSIGRIGRSIGVHLLLSSQRIESGKLRGLDTYLSYRLGLRTFSEAESRTVLETPDAFALPPLPGFGYLKVDTTIYQRFKSAYVSGPLRDAADDLPAVPSQPRMLPVPMFGAVPEPAAEARPVAPRTGSTLLGTVVEQLRPVAPPVPRIWLPPLPNVVTLDRVGGGVRATTDGLRLRAADAPRPPADRLQAERPRAGGGLRVPIGVLDDPAKQWQGTWQLDLSASGGHLAVIGGPQSGKSTLLRTLGLGLALTHRPSEVASYAIDLLAGGPRALAELPHVGGVAGRTERERIRRTVEEVRAMVGQREQVFRARGIDSPAALRVAHAAGRLPELPTADVVLMIDGFGQLGGGFEEIEPAVHEVLARGSGFGVHVVAAVSRWNEIRMAQQAAFGTRIELRLNEPADSVIDRRKAATVPENRPGRALTDRGLLAHVALPRLDDIPEAHALGEATARAAKAVRASWGDRPVAPLVRVLPAELPAAELAGVWHPTAVPIGVEEHQHAPALVDLFGRDQHLLVLGDGRSGKTNLLKVLIAELTSRYSSDELVFAVVDPRRGLQGLVPDEYLGAYASSAPMAERLASAVCVELANRAPGESAPTPRIVLLVDDYDVLAAGGTQPLAEFASYLAAAGDLALHAVVTRKVSGAARGLYEPFTLALRESGVLGLVMSGDRSEGQLFTGVRASMLPPGRGILVRQGEAPLTIQIAMAGVAS